MADFSAERDGKNAYVLRWIERNVPKIVHHSVALERSMALAAEIGLPATIQQVSNPIAINSAGWWITRKPLPWNSGAPATGKTARELRLKVVSHRTALDAWENLMRSPIGTVNAFASDSTKVGEASDHGVGFYAREGERNVDRGGPSVIIDVEPDALEGRDFVIGPESQTRGTQRMVIWKGGSGMRVRDAQQSANDASDFLRRLIEAGPGEDQIDEWRTQQRHFDRAAAALTGSDRNRFRRQLLQWVRTMGYDQYHVAKLWFSTEAAASYPTVIDALLRQIPAIPPSDGMQRTLGFMVLLALENPRVAAHPKADGWGQASAQADGAKRCGRSRRDVAGHGADGRMAHTSLDARLDESVARATGRHGP